MFKLHLVNQQFGQILNADGSLLKKGEKLAYQTNFKTIDEALNIKDILLTAVSNGLIRIYDEDNGEEFFYSNV